MHHRLKEMLEVKKPEKQIQKKSFQKQATFSLDFRFLKRYNALRNVT